MIALWGLLEAKMSLLQKTDIYADRHEKADRRRPDYGFILALICVALALVAVNVMFGSAPSDAPLVGPWRARKRKNRSNAALEVVQPPVSAVRAETHLCGEKRTISVRGIKSFCHQGRHCGSFGRTKSLGLC
jgi:hypothetical protein